MKNFAIVLTALATLSLVGCKKKDEKKVEPAKAAEPAAKPAEAPAVEPAAAVDPAAAAADPAAAAADMNTGITECDDLIKRYAACEKMPAESKAAFMESTKAWKAAAAGTDEVKKATADACKQAMTGAETGFKAMGC